MRITLSNRIATIAAGAVIVAGAQVLAAHAGAGSRTADGAVLQAATSPAAQAAAIRYWSTGRMAAALQAASGPPPSRRIVRRLVKEAPEPSARRELARSDPWLTGNTTGHGLRWTHGGAVADAVGKVFFTLGNADYVCSGALVGGAHPDVVLTAAHCVTGGLGRGATAWATNWLFVPGYRNGQSPYGEYTARRFFVTSDWSGPANGREQYDVAFVQLAAGTPDGGSGTPDGGSGTASPPPGLTVKFAASQGAVPASRAYVFGYPSLPPYTGLDPDYCAGPVAATSGSLRTSCGMTAGDSGGPWLAAFSPLSGSGAVVAVSTYKLSGNLSVLYGAVLGPQARTLYARAVS
jgi:V8-like Glu-specific endopeptidase